MLTVSPTNHPAAIQLGSLLSKSGVINIQFSLGCVKKIRDYCCFGVVSVGGGVTGFPMPANWSWLLVKKFLSKYAIPAANPTSNEGFIVVQFNVVPFSIS